MIGIGLVDGVGNVCFSENFGNDTGQLGDMSLRFAPFGRTRQNALWKELQEF